MTVLRYGPMSENGVLGAIPGLTDGWTPSWKRRSWRIVDRLTWTVTGWNENRFRRRIGLPRARTPLPHRLRERGIRQIQAYDPEIVPGLVEEWDDHRPVVGFFSLPAHSMRAVSGNGAGAEVLEEWLDAGEPPVFITFGSMPILDPQALRARWRTLAARAGFRCLFSLGEASGTDPHDPDVFYAGALDHASILPRCAAIVHHGGAGTTAAGLRAGLPTLICAVTADQPFWGQRIRELGLGEHLSLSTFEDPEALAALRKLGTSEMVSAAGVFARRMIPADKAVAAAADVCESELD